MPAPLRALASGLRALYAQSAVLVCGYFMCAGYFLAKVSCVFFLEIIDARAETRERPPRTRHQPPEGPRPATRA